MILYRKYGRKAAEIVSMTVDLSVVTMDQVRNFIRFFKEPHPELFIEPHTSLGMLPERIITDEQLRLILSMHAQNNISRIRLRTPSLRFSSSTCTNVEDLVESIGDWEIHRAQPIAHGIEKFDVLCEELVRHWKAGVPISEQDVHLLTNVIVIMRSPPGSEDSPDATANISKDIDPMESVTFQLWRTIVMPSEPLR